MAEDGPLVRWAIRLASLAPVSPLIGKEPPAGTRGHLMATQAVGMIRRQFGEHPTATGFGVRTGQSYRGGYLGAVDIDPRHGGGSLSTGGRRSTGCSR